MKNISVSDNVHKQLIQLRNQFGFKHHSKTIETLIESYQSTPKKIDALRNLTEQEQSIKHQLLELMREWPNRTWLIQEFTNKVMNSLNTSYDEAKQYALSLLQKIPEIEKVYDVKFRNFGNGSGYRLISKNSII